MDGAVSRGVHRQYAAELLQCSLQQHEGIPIQVLVLRIAQRKDCLSTEAFQARKLLLHWKVCCPVVLQAVDGGCHIHLSHSLQVSVCISQENHDMKVMVSKGAACRLSGDLSRH